jgi:glucose-1-phosphate cytidylyltransferase
MKVVILAGGFGSRLSEETDIKPKPMVNIGGKPILWHIMKTYSSYGFNEFVILLGYKGYVFKEYFSNYFLHQSDVTIDLKDNNIEIHRNFSEPWKITLLDTGINTLTGGRIKRAKNYINNETFFLTYGDGLSDVNIDQLLKNHQKQNNLLTMTAVQPMGRYGSLKIDDEDKVTSFLEKPLGDGSWINGGFFVCEPSVIDYIENDQSIFEQKPLMNLAKNNQLNAFKHNGFWACMDTLRDKNYLLELWNNKKAPWKVWE